jgi:hypothetical protein
VIDGEHSRHGLGSLPRDLTDAELNAAPVLMSLDVLIIEDLSADEADAFIAALEA